MTPISERLREHARSATTPLNCRFASAQAADIIDAVLEALEELAPELRIMAEWAHDPSLSAEYAAKFERARAAIARARGEA